MLNPVTPPLHLHLDNAIAPPLSLPATARVADAMALVNLPPDPHGAVWDLDAALGQLLHQAQQSCVLVMEGDRPVGMVTASDLARIATTGADPSTTAIAEVMVTPVPTLPLAALTDISVPFQWFQCHPLRHLPLVDDQGQVVGVLALESLWQQALQERTRQMQAQVERATLLAQIAERSQTEVDLPAFLAATVDDLRSVLPCDRLLIDQFQPDGNSAVIAQAGDEPLRSHCHAPIEHPWFRAQVAALKDGAIAIDDLHTAGYPEDYRTLLQSCQVTALVAVPIRVAGQCWGLLIGYQCHPGQSWQAPEVSLLQQVAVQMAIAIQQAHTQQQLQQEVQIKHQVETALHHSESELQSLFAVMDDVVIVLNRQGIYVKILSTHSSKLYRPVEELLGTSLYDHFSTEQADFFLNYVQQALDTGEIQECEYRLPIDHTERWFNTKCHPLTADTVLWVARDISQRKQAELELQQQRELLRIVIDTIPNKIFVKDWDGRFLLANRALADACHLTVEEVVGQYDREIYPETAVTRFLQENRTVIANQQPLFLPEEPAVFDGEKRWFQWYKHPITSPGSNLSAVLGVGVDITRRKLAEAVLHQYERVVSATTDGMALIDRDYVYRLVNHVYLEWHEKNRDEIVGHSIAELLGEKIFQTLVKPRLDRCLAGTIQQYEDWFEYRNGGRRFVRVTYSPYIEADGSIAGIVVSTHDLTVIKQAEMRLELQNTLLEQIARAEPLAKVLNTLLEAMELQLAGALCSILLCDRQGHLRRGPAPQLPESYLQAVDGVVIGDGVGSCGTAVFRKTTIIVSDIATDPLWQDYRDLALEHGLRACWSFPILASDGRALGAFGVYYRQIHAPSESELAVAALAANIAGIAIEQAQAKQTLEQLNRDLEQRVEDRTAALQVSEERWHLALRGANDGIWDWDLIAQTMFFSSRWKQMRGFRDDEINNSADECISRIHPDDIDRVTAAIEEHLAGHTEFFEIEYRSLRKDGSYMWVLDRAQALRDASGQVVRMSGSETDISDRKQAEEALRESERRYATLAAAAPVAIFRFDTPLNCVYVNDRWSEMTGRSRESAMGRGWTAALHPDDREAMLAQWTELYTHASPQDLKVFGCEGRHLHTDGTVRWYYCQVAQETDATGDVVGYIGTLTDITERKHSERELQLTQYSVDHAADGILWIKADGAFFYANRAVCQMLGYSADELLGMTIFEIDPNILPDTWAAAWEREKSLKECVMESVHRAKDGHLYPVELLGTFLTLDDQEFEMVRVRDISERVQLETQRQQAEAALRRSEQRYRAVMDHASDAIILADVQGQLIEVNQQAEALLGYSRDEWMQLNISQIHPPDVLDAVYQHFNGILLQNRGPSFETLVLHKDGSRIPVEITGSRIEFEGGLLAQGIFRDIRDRKRTEQQLYNLSERLNLAIQAAQIGIWEWDVINRRLIWDDRMCALYGIRREEFTGRYEDWQQRVHPDDRIEQHEAAHIALQGESDQDVIFRVIHPDGTVRFLSAMSLIQRNELGEPLRVIGLNIDITHRKLAEQETQRLKERLQFVLSSSPAVIYTCRVGGAYNCTFVSDNVQLVLGYRPEQYLSQPGFWADHIHPDDAPRVFADLHLLFEQGHHVHEYRILHQDGTYRWLHDELRLVCDDQGTPLEIVGYFADVSDRQRLEQEQHRLLAILEASTDYISISDITGQIIWNNTTLKHLCGLEGDAVVRQRQIADYHPQWATERILQQGLPGAIATGSWLGETAILNAEGQEIPVSQLILAHRSPQGDVEYFSTIARDIRARKDYERQLERSNAEMMRATRLKDEFLANMSHELRTPLNAILGMSEALQEQVFGTLSKDQLQAIATVERSGRHLLALINDILEVSKIAAGKLELDITPTSVAHLCNSSLVFVKQQALKKRLKLTTLLAPELGTIAADERRMRQVLINLLNNAVKFTPEGGQIRLEVRVEDSTAPSHSPPAIQAPGRWILFSVTDTGIGIAAADQAKLFQPFVQIDSSLNRHYEGTGLGLTLVKQIVELHGGWVTLTSTLGEGSCFTVYLPYTGDTGVVPPSTSAPEISEQIPGIIPTSQPPLLQAGVHPLLLIAEDDQGNIDTLFGYLEAHGYRLLLARSGQEAIALALAHQPDVILMDVQMPGMDGLEAIRTMRQHPHLAQTPIIALTALAMEGDRDRCLSAGANDYIAKPLRLKQLVATIHHLISW